MWPFKKPEKSKVFVFKSGIVTYDPDKVEVEFERSPEYDKAYKKGMKAMDNLDEIYRKAMAVSFNPVYVEPKPDTIKSLINRLIELGEPKPEVVITGEKRADGRESYTATVDGKLLEWVRDDTWESQSVARDFALIEKAVICALETRIASVVAKTTTITY